MRVRLGMLLGTVAALAVAIPTLLHSFVLMHHLETAISDDNLELARAVGALTEHQIEQVVIALQMTVASPHFAEEIRSRDTDRLRERLTRVVQIDDDLVSVMVVDREGIVWLHTIDDSPLVGQNVGNRYGLDEAVATGQPTVGQPFVGPIVGAIVVPVAVPFRDQYGEIAGALRATLSLDRLTQRISSVRPSARGRVNIVDADGRLLTAPDPSLILTDAATSDPSIRAALGGETVVRRTVDPRGPVFAAALPIRHGWVVDVHSSVDEARAPLIAQMTQAALFALGAFAVATIAGLIIARRVTEPLLILLRAVRSIREDEAYAPLPRSSTTELAWLADEIEATRAVLDARTRAMCQAVERLDRDIAAREAAEIALRAGESQYRGLVENIEEIVFQIDMDGRWTFLNPAWTRITGFTMEESLGRSFMEFVYPDDRAPLQAAFGALLRQKTTVRRTELRYLTRSGSVRLLEGYATPMSGPDGQVLGMSGALLDVTERRAVEADRERVLVHAQEARAYEERAAEVTGIVQHMPCGVLVFDMTGCLTLANERAVEMLSIDDATPGTSGRSLVPHPTDLLDDRLLAPCRTLVARALAGNVVRDRELGAAAPGLSDRELLGSAAPLRSAQGEVRGAVAILTDVTRERRLMRDLLQSEASLRHSLESLLVLHEAGRALSSTLVEEEIGSRLVESCVRIARLDAALVILDDGQADARVLGTHGDRWLIDHVLACEEASRSRREALRHPSSAGLRPAPSCGHVQRATGHHIALVARGRTVGVLEIYGAERPQPVTVDALASLAAHAVSAFENAHLYREVGDREQRLQDALRQLLSAQEEERRRVAYELHDGLAQVAAAAHRSLETFASQYRPRSEPRRQQLDRGVELSRRVVREARQVIAGLRPTVLDDFGLERAIRLLVNELVGEGWTIEYEAQLGTARLPGATETVLYRIVQEALTNVQKHAGTLAATVSVRRHDGYVDLEIVDRGVGFQPGALSSADVEPGQRVGLVGMRERAAMVGGWCVVESQPGEGTRVSVRIPVQDDGVTSAPGASSGFSQGAVRRAG